MLKLSGFFGGPTNIIFIIRSSYLSTQNASISIILTICLANDYKIPMHFMQVILAKLKEIKDCKVVLVDNELVIFVSSQNDSVIDISASVSQCVTEALPQHYWPDRVRVLENLPLTRHGKTLG